MNTRIVIGLCVLTLFIISLFVPFSVRPFKLGQSINFKELTIEQLELHRDGNIFVDKLFNKQPDLSDHFINFGADLSVLQIPTVDFSYKTCISINNFVKKEDNDLVFISNGPVGMKIAIDDSQVVVDANEYKDNYEYCVLNKNINFIELSTRESSISPEIYKSLCGEQEVCELSGRFQLLWSTKILNPWSSIVAAFLISLMLAVLYAKYIWLPAEFFSNKTNEKNKTGV
ncbi:hypothetical protein A3D88_02525 [Candidatus Peribacteria bacterium RIFCSPHIGHO2_02_FULL_52_16]|nr:MAG: hypothetical protein A2706_00350 [Candidatus Peribacteria bacterium RIFCSPHIGHO2_01_FULL_51_35]OGJ61637.1 MAG: hypothetical protein A3D88_02525 [Candidatus Peribacteria bacterium RIFCSPHIGHO2_02_FULL_52_16]